MCQKFPKGGSTIRHHGAREVFAYCHTMLADGPYCGIIFCENFSTCSISCMHKIKPENKADNICIIGHQRI